MKLIRIQRIKISCEPFVEYAKKKYNLPDKRRMCTYLKYKFLLCEISKHINFNGNV